MDFLGVFFHFVQCIAMYRQQYFNIFMLKLCETVGQKGRVWQAVCLFAAWWNMLCKKHYHPRIQRGGLDQGVPFSDPCP